MNDSSLIEQYELGPEKLAHAVQGLTAEDLLQVPDPDAGVGLWSIQQVVLHLADAEMAFADRMRRVIAEENPPLVAWDETRFAKNLFYEQQSAGDAVKLIELTRRNLVKVLRQLPPGAFERFGTHSQRGRQTLREIISTDVQHLEHHVGFIVNKRERFGKVMW
jgi:uncharacterized damage-inducible protein DinB